MVNHNYVEQFKEILLSSDLCGHTMHIAHIPTHTHAYKQKTNFIITTSFFLFAAKFKLDHALTCFWNLTCSPHYGVWLTLMYCDNTFEYILIRYSAKLFWNVQLSFYKTKILLEILQNLSWSLEVWGLFKSDLLLCSMLFSQTPVEGDSPVWQNKACVIWAKNLCNGLYSSQWD